MLTLAAEISRIEGNTAYADRYWDIITTWADYLVEHGLDPANQLCTDDFAGHWAHNANLALKAIMGVAGYAKMAEIRGNADVAKRYMDKAREMGKPWYSKRLSIAKGLRLDDKTERRRDLRPRGWNR